MRHRLGRRAQSHINIMSSFANFVSGRGDWPVRRQVGEDGLVYWRSAPSNAYCLAKSFAPYNIKYNIGVWLEFVEGTYIRVGQILCKGLVYL